MILPSKDGKDSKGPQLMDREDLGAQSRGLGFTTPITSQEVSFMHCCWHADSVNNESVPPTGPFLGRDSAVEQCRVAFSSSCFSFSDFSFFIELGKKVARGIFP